MEKQPSRHENPNAPADMLESLRLALEMNPSETPGIPAVQREILKRHIITARWEDCHDMGMGKEADKMITEYYTK